MANPLSLGYRPPLDDFKEDLDLSLRQLRKRGWEYTITPMGPGIEYAERQREQGLNVSPAERAQFEGQDFLRLAVSAPRIEYTGKGPETRHQSLILDVQPGPTSPFGQTVEERTRGGWNRIFGGEVIGTPEEGLDLRTPMQSFRSYITAAFESAQNRLSSQRAAPQSWWSSITSGGTMDRPDVTQVAGGVMRAGPVHPQAAWTDYASRLTVGFSQELKTQDLWSELFRQAEAAPRGSIWSNINAMAPWQGDDKVLRMRRVGMLEDDSGEYDYNVLGIGKSASDILKRLNLVVGGGLRERAKLYGPTEDRTSMQEIQPQMITGMGEGQAGYRWLNAIMPGQSRREAGIIRPGTMVMAASPFPGNMLTYENVLQGVYSAGQPSQQTFKLNVPDMRDLAKAQFRFGVMEEEKFIGPLEEGISEKDRPVVAYNKQRDLEGYVLEGGRSAVIGTYSLPGQVKNEAGELENTMIERPLRATAEGRPVFFTGGQPTLHVPPAYTTDINNAGKGHPGVTADREIPLKEGPDFSQPEADLLAPATESPQPPKTSPLGGILNRLRERFPGTVSPYERNETFVTVPAAFETGQKLTGGIKVVATPAAGIGEMTPEMRQAQITPEMSTVINAVTADVKNELVNFEYAFAGLPTARQSEMMRRAYPGEMGSRLASYIEREGIRTAETPEEGALSLDRLAKRWSMYREGVRYAPERTAHQMFTELRGRVQDMGNETTWNRFGMAFGVQGTWSTAVSPYERRVLRREFMRGMSLAGIEGQDARRKYREMMKFTPMEGGKRYMWSMTTQANMQALTSPFSPEYMTKLGHLGFEEMSALEAAMPELARELGLATEGQGPESTGFQPKHARAWREVGNVYRWRQERPEMQPTTRVEMNADTRQRIRDDITAQSVSGPLSLEQLDTIIGGQGPLYNPDSGELIERPSTMADITAWEYDDPDFMEALNRFTRQYYSAFDQFLAGGQAKEGGGLAALEAERRKVFESQAGTAVKTYNSRFLAQAIGGRYSWGTGLGPNEVGVQEERMRQMFRQTAAAQDVAPTEGRMRGWLKQVTERLGLPGFIKRDPINARLGGVQPAQFVTPEVIKEQTGIDIPRAGRLSGGLIVPGWAEATGQAAQMGVMARGFSGDWDDDPMLMAASFKFDEENPENIIRRDANELRQLGGRNIKSAMKAQDEVLAQQFGYGGTKVPGGSLDVLANAFQEMAFDPFQDRSTAVATAQEMQQEGLGRIKERGGMGVVFNLRRLLESSGSALGLSGQNIIAGHTAQGLGYQRYTDYLVGAGKKGGFPSLETFMQTSILTVNKKGTRAARWLAMTSRDAPFVEMWRSHEGAGSGYSLSRSLGSALTSAVARDIEEGHIQPQAAAYMFSRRGDDLAELTQTIEGASDPWFGLNQIVGREGYDIMESPIGLAAMANVVGKTEGWLGRTPRTITDDLGNEFEVSDRIKNQPFPWRGEIKQFKELQNTDEIFETTAGYQTLTRKGSLVSFSTTNRLRQILRRRQAAGIEASQLANFQQSQYQGAEADASARAAEAIRRANQIMLPAEIPPLESDTPRIDELQGTQIRPAERARSGTARSSSLTGGLRHRKLGLVSMSEAKMLPAGSSLRRSAQAAAGGGDAGDTGGRGGGGDWYGDPFDDDWSDIPEEERRRMLFQAQASARAGLEAQNLMYPGGLPMRMEHYHYGQNRNPILTRQDIQKAYGSVQRLTSLMGPYGEQFRGFAGQFANMLGGVTGEAASDILASPDTIAQQYAKAMEMDPKTVMDFISQNRGLITELEREGKIIVKGESGLRSGIGGSFEPEVATAIRGVLNASPQAPTNIRQAGQGLYISNLVGPEGRAAGVLTGKSKAFTDEEMEAIDTARSRLKEAMEESAKTFEKHKDSMDDEMVSRKDLMDVLNKQRARQLEVDYQVAKAETRRTTDAYEAQRSVGWESAEQEGRLYSQMTAAERREFETSRQLQRAQAEEAGPGPGAAGRMTRRLIGGWGLFYMRHLMGLGMGQFQQGYAEAEQYQTATTMGAIGQVGVGAGISPYGSPEMRYQQALIRSGGGVYRQLRGLGVDAAGTPLSDVGGAALTGLGAYGIGMHIAGSMQGIAGLSSLQAGLAGAMPAIGIGVGAAALVGTQIAYARDIQNQQIGAAAQLAPQLGGGGLSELSGNASMLWRTGGASIWDWMTGEPETAFAKSERYAQQINQMINGGTPMAPNRQPMSFDRARTLSGIYSGDIPNTPGVPLSPEEMLTLSQGYGMADIEGLEGLDPAMKSQLAFQALRYNYGQIEAGQTPMDITEFVRSVGTAQAAGMPVDQMARAVGAIGGQQLRPGAGYTPLEYSISQLTPQQQARLQQGLGLMGQIPGIQRQLQGQTDYQITTAAMGDYADIAGGPWEERFIQREGLREQRLRAGLSTTATDMGRYERGVQWSPLDFAQEEVESDLLSGGYSMQVGLRQRGVAPATSAIAVSALEQSYAGLQFGNQALAASPYRMAQMAQIGAFAEAGSFQGVPIGELLANIDINQQGDITGLPWGTTSLNRGQGNNADLMANQVWGSRWQGTGWGEAAVNGIQMPNGQTVAGMRGLQYYQMQQQYEQQQAGMGIQLAQLQLSYDYQMQSWGIQDRQRALGREQSLWGFEMQDRQFAMQGRQFMENRGLQAQQMNLTRQFTQEGWQYQDQMRAMQFGWQQEDYAEGVRFMSGRQRRLAERQMERQTTVYNLEGDRIETQRDQQKELWALEDQRFELAKSHFDEQRQLQEENMKKQREFYEEGYSLQTEAIDAQREYWLANHELQKQAAGLQAEYAEKTKEIQEAMMELRQEQDDYTALLGIATQEGVAMTNAIVDGLNYIVKNAPKALESILSENPYQIPTFNNPGKTTGGDNPSEYAMGGTALPGETILVGEEGAEVIKMKDFGQVLNKQQIADATRMMSIAEGRSRDRWNDSVSLSPRGESSGQPAVINVYLGGELLKRIILDTVSQDLEVS